MKWRFCVGRPAIPRDHPSRGARTDAPQGPPAAKSSAKIPPPPSAPTLPFWGAKAMARCEPRYPKAASKFKCKRRSAFASRTPPKPSLPGLRCLQAGTLQLQDQTLDFEGCPHLGLPPLLRLTDPDVTASCGLINRTVLFVALMGADTSPV